MSGFEILGVVLGSIPLIVSALEHYAEGVRTMKNMKEYEYVFSDIHTSFAASVAIFQNSCYQLLGPLNLSDQKMNDLLVQRSTEAWKAPTLQNNLEKRLGPNYTIYPLLISKLNKRPPWISQDGTIDERARKKFFRNLWTRINGGFKSSKFGELLQDIDNDIAKISQLTAGGLELEPLRLERLNQMHSAYWENIRDQAQRLFDSLSSRFNTCSCHHPHKATLRLDARKSDVGEEVVRFAFLLTFEKSECYTKELPWDWRDIEIETSPRSSAPSVAQVQSPLSHSLNILIAEQGNSQFIAIYEIHDDDNGNCTAIHLCFISIINDYHNTRSSNQISDMAPIKEVICDNKSRMTTIDKYSLAYTLASAVLQLYNTPWLPTAWSSNDIFILKSSSGTTLPSQYYTSRTFGSPSTHAAIAQTRRCVKNEMVFALGVALLELSYGQRLVCLQTPDDLNDQGVEDSMTEVSIATRLADRIHEREMENYAKSVLRCVRCSFDTFSCDFKDQGFREKFFKGVVEPLRANYEYATAGRL
ncbi:MAG: hypothetical protein M1822_009152 [Bathelium mastoideum]|nr:MAG: hypothetical protein M1822_009152 [Bathelium mastoideum]